MDGKLGRTFKLTKKLGSGAFGEIFHGRNLKNNVEVAIKLEHISTQQPQLLYEAKLYQHLLLNENQNDRGIPQVYYCATEGQYNIMVMDLLGPSLEDHFLNCGKKFTLQTVLKILDQMINRIEFIHSKHYLHRDIKPNNFLTGIGKRAQTIYLIDFGLAKRYIMNDGCHIPYKDQKKLTGTVRFASVNTHLGVQQSRRDDLESLGYVMIYFLKGSLPWQNLSNEDINQTILQKKNSTHVEILCSGLPSQFAEYLSYCKNLNFEEKPDYDYCRKLFLDLTNQPPYTNDYIYDWNIDSLEKKKDQMAIDQQEVVSLLKVRVHESNKLVKYQLYIKKQQLMPFNHHFHLTIINPPILIFTSAVISTLQVIRLDLLFLFNDFSQNLHVLNAYVVSMSLLFHKIFDSLENHNQTLYLFSQHNVAFLVFLKISTTKFMVKNHQYYQPFKSRMQYLLLLLYFQQQQITFFKHFIKLIIFIKFTQLQSMQLQQYNLIASRQQFTLSDDYGGIFMFIGNIVFKLGFCILSLYSIQLRLNSNSKQTLMKFYEQQNKIKVNSHHFRQDSFSRSEQQKLSYALFYLMNDTINLKKFQQQIKFTVINIPTQFEKSLNDRNALIP